MERLDPVFFYFMAGVNMQGEYYIENVGADPVPTQIIGATKS